MTPLLQRAVLEARKLPEQLQNALGALLTAEIESEVRWSNSFENSQDLLATLATEAANEDVDGKIQTL